MQQSKSLIIAESRGLVSWIGGRASVFSLFTALVGLLWILLFPLVTITTGTES